MKVLRDAIDLVSNYKYWAFRSSSVDTAINGRAGKLPSASSPSPCKRKMVSLLSSRRWRTTVNLPSHGDLMLFSFCGGLDCGRIIHDSGPHGQK